LIAVSLLAGACLNPLNFSEDDLPTIKVEIEGSIRIEDVAVMWLINRTKTVDVTSFTITRPKIASESDVQYTYPKNFTGKPKAGESLASYHMPLETPYTITVSWEDKGEPGSWTKSVQFPRPQDYKFYLYRTSAGVVIVDEDKMTQTPDPDDYTPGTDPSTEGAQPFVVFNVTPDQNVDEVEFVKDNAHFVISEEPKAKDQKMILLSGGAGVNYRTVARYTKNGSKATSEKNITVTPQEGSMAVRTNFVYFYKTKSGDYQLSPTWPPVPDDSSDENKPEDALADGQGILKVVNKANQESAHALIAKINIDGVEYPDPPYTPYMISNDVKMFVLPAGDAHVSFKPTDQDAYGMVITREILSKQITTLEYTGNLANPDIIPPDTEGHGTGLIRITNNSTAVVESIVIRDRLDLSKTMSMGYEDFSPPYPIQYGGTGRIAVYGTSEFPLNPGAYQLVQVVLQTTDSLVVVERVAVIRNAIVDIFITQDELSNNKRVGSKVTVTNNTTSSTSIISMVVSSETIPGPSVGYNLSIPNTVNNNTQSVYVLTTTTLPIIEGHHYAANLTVLGANGQMAVISKSFVSDGYLYSVDPDTHTRTITLVESDLDPFPNLKEKFVAITNMEPSSLTLSSKIDNANALVEGGKVNLSQIVTIIPNTATKQGPIEWSLELNPETLVSLNPQGLLEVQKVPSSIGDKMVKVKATIAGAAGILGATVDFTHSIDITLKYAALPPSSNPVTSLGLKETNKIIQVGESFNLSTLVSLNPSDAHLAGVPITASAVMWAIPASNYLTPSTNTTITGANAIITGKAPGTVTITATLDSPYTTTGPLSKTCTITVAEPPHPDKVLLRFIKLNDSDYVQEVCLIPTIDTHELEIYGQTTINDWALIHAHKSKGDLTYATYFRQAVTDLSWYKGLTKMNKKGDYADLVVNWPAGTNPKYYLYFIEGDSRVRGYVNPGQLDPDREKNFKFFLDIKTLYEVHKFRMNGNLTDLTNGTMVIPIAYDSYRNMASLMYVPKDSSGNYINGKQPLPLYRTGVQ
jgi:hypothetical protein